MIKQQLKKTEMTRLNWSNANLFVCTQRKHTNTEISDLTAAPAIWEGQWLHRLTRMSNSHADVTYVSIPDDMESPR